MAEAEPSALDDAQAARLFATPSNRYFRYGGLAQVSAAGHPYCIGVRHVEMAADHFGGILNEAAIRRAESAGYRCRLQINQKQFCNLPWTDHQPQPVLRIELSAVGLAELDLTGAKLDLNKVPGLHAYLLEIKPQLVAHRLAGCIFPTVKEAFDEVTGSDDARPGDAGQSVAAP